MKKKGKAILAAIIGISTLFSSAVYAEEGQQQQFATRAEFSHALAELLREKGVWGTEKESDGFADISPEKAFYADILLLEEIGIVNGDGNGNFRPDDLISYQEAVTMLGRSFRGNEWIAENCGTYPEGHLIFAAQEGLLNGIAMRVDMPVSRSNMETLLENTGKKIRVYPDLVQKLGCDDYTGQLYIDYYPKHWQGYSQKPIDSSTGYFHIVPEKVLYSYDNETWHVAYETIDGKTVFYGLPEYVEAARYNWAYKVFESVPYHPEAMYHSYDYKTWYPGPATQRKYEDLAVTEESFPFGIQGASLFTDTASGLYFSFLPYETEYYMSKTYGIEMVETKSNIIWASKDQVNWIGITLPEEVYYYKSFTVRSDIKGIRLDCAVDFTEEEQQYLDVVEKQAEEAGGGYDRPPYKYETYLVSFDDILKLF